MKELGEIGKAYREAYQGWEQLQSLQLQDLDVADTYDDAIEQARLVMQILDRKGAGQDFAEVILDPPTEDPEIERQRNNILNLKNNTNYKNGLITDEDIEEELSRLPQAENYEFSEDDRRISAAYFVGQFLSSTPMTGLKLGERVLTDVADSGLEGTINPEQEQTPVTIKLYTVDNMLVINDTEAIPLARKVGNAKYTAEEETSFEKMRAEALIQLALDPDAIYDTAQLRRLTVPEGQSLDSAPWNNFVGDWLREDLQFNGTPLVKSWKPSPEARQRYFQWNGPVPNIEVVDEDSGLVSLSIFKLPNGEVIAGNEGLVANLLIRATEQNPVTTQTLIDMGIYTDEEIAEAKEKSQFILTSRISSLRGNLRRVGLEDRLVVCRTDVENVATGRKESGYWMERHELIISPSSELDEASENDYEIAEEEADNPTEQTEVVATPEDIHESRQVAEYIHSRRAAFDVLGVPSLPDVIVTELVQLDGQSSNGVLDSESIRQLATSWLDGAQNETNLEEIFDLPTDDPRWPMIEHFFAVAGDEKAAEKFVAVINAESKDVSDPNDAQTIVTEYVVDGEGTVRVTQNGEDTKAELVVASEEESDNNNGGTRLSRKERRNQVLRELEPKAKRLIKTTLAEMHLKGLDKPEGIRSGRLSQVYPRTESVRHSILGRSSEKGAITTEEALILVLATCDDDDLKKAIELQWQRRAVDDWIEDMVERHRRALERKAETEQQSKL